MNIYAVLNENNICTGISQLSGEVSQPNMIEISEFSDEYIWKKYENGQWSTEKFEPATTAPIDEFTDIKNQVVALNIAIAEILGM